MIHNTHCYNQNKPNENRLPTWNIDPLHTLSTYCNVSREVVAGA
jgi:hypothetical protein